MKNYLETLVGTSTWDEYLSGPALGFDYLTYRLPFWAVGELLDISVTQLLLIQRIILQVFGFVGAFLLSRDYIIRYHKTNRIAYIIIASALAGLIYGINPSFLIGDSFWLGIEFAYLSFPWIIWTFNKVVFDRNWKYIFLCAILMSLNISEHFWTTAFPIFLFFYAVSTTILFTIKHRKLTLFPIAAFGILIASFASLISYRLIGKITTISPYQLSQTLLGLDVDWQNGTVQNMLRASTHLDLPFIYQTSNSYLSFLNSLMLLTVLIPFIALIAILLYRKNWIVNFYTALLGISILPFFSGSPFKGLHYWLFFSTPFAPSFRSWRVPDSFIAISLAVLIGFTIFYLLNRLSTYQTKNKSEYKLKILNLRKYTYIFVIAGMFFLSTIYSWPLFTGDVNGMLKSVDLPQAYLEAHSFLDQQPGNFRTIYIPDFLYSYGEGSGLKPFWSPEKGAIEEFLIYPVAKPALPPLGWYSHFYFQTLSPRYHSLLSNDDFASLSRFLTWANIKYLVIHDDIPSISSDTKSYIDKLSNSKYFRLAFQSDFIYIFENVLADENKFSTSTRPILVDGGYRVAASFYARFENQTEYAFIFADQHPTIDLNNYGVILSDKHPDQLVSDFMFTSFTHGINKVYLYPYAREHNPEEKWSRASYLDPHQNEWHPYISSWQNYSWDFDYGKGLIFTNNSDDVLTIPISVNESGNYYLLIRYLANTHGGTFDVSVGGKTMKIKSIDAYNGFFWAKLPIELTKGHNEITISNKEGFNALSVLYVLPETEYYTIYNNASQALLTKNVINPNNRLSFTKNIINNTGIAHDSMTFSSFEEGYGGWQIDTQQDSDAFDLIIDSDDHFAGNYSLKVISNAERERWSWIRSDWIDVAEGERYTLVTHMKGSNVNASHIVLEAFDQYNNRSFQLGQVPSDGYGTFDWRTTTGSFVIPQNVTKIRIDLNAGWPENSSQEAITWFDDIVLYQSGISASSVEELFQHDSHPVDILKEQKISPSMWIVKVNSDKPFILSFPESYNPNWKAFVKEDLSESQLTNSITNGFWIKETGEIDIIVEYLPQRWYQLGLALSLLTILAWSSYIAIQKKLIKTPSRQAILEIVKRVLQKHL